MYVYTFTITQLKIYVGRNLFLLDRFKLGLNRGLNHLRQKPANPVNCSSTRDMY